MLSFLFLFLSLGSVFFCLFSIFCAWDFFSKPLGPQGPAPLPPVSILKPIRGDDGNTYENLSSFCRQDYPRFQIVFGVGSPQDPAVPAIERLMRDFPHLELDLVVSDRSLGANPKVNSLLQMMPRARYPNLLVCDGDIRAHASFLRRVMEPFSDPGVGAVTCMCRSSSKGWLETLEALRESTEFCPGVLAARRLGGIRFGLGSGILVRKEALEKIGGFSAIADYLADDYLLGNRIAQAGYRVILSREVVEHELSLTTFKNLVQRQVRWNRGIRVCRRLGYYGLIFTYGIPMSLLLLWASRGSLLGWIVAAAAWTARLTMAFAIGAGYLADRAARKFLWAVPVQDLLSFVLWILGLAGSKVWWRDQAFRLTAAGRLVPLSSPPSATLC